MSNESRIIVANVAAPVREVPPVGAEVLPTEWLPTIQTFLGLDSRAARKGP